MFASRNRVISYRHRALICTLSFVLGAIATTVHAQKYQTIPVNLADKDISRLKMAFESARRNPAGFGASQQDVEDYLKKAYFPSMTLYTDQALMELTPSRDRLIKQYIPQAGNATSQQYLIDMTFNVARVLARGNYHPAVRYNAVLMLGDLDQQLATGANPPVPMAKATQELLELIEQEQFNKIAVPESVKLGALLGLERHTRYGIDPPLAERLTKTMLGVMASKTPEDVEPDVHNWLRSAAAKVLTNQYAKGTTKEVQDALTAQIADKSLGLDDRCTVAGALGKVTYVAGADLDGNAATDALAQLSLDVITHASQLARDYQKEALSGADLSGGYGGGGGSRRGGYRGEFGGGRGGGYGEEEDRGPRFERRELFAQLYSIASGGNSLKAGLGDDAKGRIEALIAEFGPTVEAMENKNATEVDVTEEVLNLEKSLKALIESWGKPVAAVESKDPAEGFAGN